ncbi:MAG: sigma-70 family RNA polymerase sigma factor [Acidobacteria bacterium]|nr:sigma-70 family RNA polymerase sigma factor [Acidobacteriota bacterium]
MAIDRRGEDVTRLLRAWRGGDTGALEQLTPIVYAELHRLAMHQMRGEREGHVLQPSALVNEAFVRLMGNAPVEWANRNQLYAVSARLMRQVLIDYARKQKRLKRVAGMGAVTLSSAGELSNSKPGFALEDMMALDECLTRLAQLNARQAQVVEMRFFGGMENAEIAAILGVSEQTVTRDWRVARAWLFNALGSPRQ